MYSEEMFINRITMDNPWWTTGDISDAYASDRARFFLDDVYAHLTDWETRRAVLLLGPRRVGKTWLMQHAVQRLLREKAVLSKDIVFVSVDVPVYHGTSLEDLLYAAARVSGADVRADRMYVFFDEVQYLKDWEVHLKTLTDAYPNIRFMASGSAASALAKGSLESGAGRFTDLKLAPLSFFEYVHLLGKADEFSNDAVKVSDQTFVFPDYPSMEKLNNLFLDYVNFGGYPELVMNSGVRANPMQFIQRDIVDKVLLRDLPSLYHIEDVRDLQSFFSYLAFHSGMVQSWESLSQGAGLKKAMIVQFLRYLEDAFLVCRHDRVDITAASLQRATQFKIYLTNTSLRASMFQPVVRADDPYIGYSVETAISAQLGIGEARAPWRYANWKAGKTQGEVDFVHIHPGLCRPDLAMEVKWSDGPFDHPAEVDQAVSFCERNGITRLWVTTRSQQGVRRSRSVELVYIPTALMAYYLGKGGLLK